MLRYVDVKEVFAEIPDEITLAISISGCPMHCKGCHSQYLWEDVGEELTKDALSVILAEHFGITCICFMGGDQDPAEVNSLALYVREHSNIRIAWYSGRDKIPQQICLDNFDYVKIGRYDEECGPLNNRGTNQILYRVEHTADDVTLTNITHRFWKN